jgi:hypothetical protein
MFPTMSMDEQMARAQLVQTKYSDGLMRKSHVLGVGIGYVTKAGQQTGEIGLVVMVDAKVSSEIIDPVDHIPSELDGVRVDVQEVGVFSAQ